MFAHETDFQNDDDFSLARRALYNDDLDTLKDLLNSDPETCVCVDGYGNNLLHLSVALQKYEIFQYLLSLNRFDLDCTNFDDETALGICLTYNEDVFYESHESFAVELIKYGANIHTVCCGNTLLHFALRRHFFKAAQLLIEKGLDVNVQNDDGCTPLHMIFHVKNHTECVDEGVGLMVYYGANTMIRDDNGNLPFELAMTYDPYIITTQENLFLCTFDSFSEYRMSVEILFALLESSSPLFSQVVEIVSEIVHVKRVSYSPIFFLQIEPESLHVMIKKFDYVISNSLRKDLFYCCDYLPGTLENWEILLNSHLASEAIELVGKLKIQSMVNANTAEAPDYIYYLLSYGLKVFDNDLEIVYKTYGYCDLFKTLLHMDVTRSRCDIIPRIFCDIHSDLFTFLEDPHDYSLKSVEVLLKYFAHPGLKKFCSSLGVRSLETKIALLPKVPLLVELARDATRKFLIVRYNLERTSQFYSVLKWLPISVIYQRILSFETILYR